MPMWEMHGGGDWSGKHNVTKSNMQQEAANRDVQTIDSLLRWLIVSLGDESQLSSVAEMSTGEQRVKQKSIASIGSHDVRECRKERERARKSGLDREIPRRSISPVAALGISGGQRHACPRSVARVIGRVLLTWSIGKPMKFASQEKVRKPS